ncbi:MAG: hypothetical protein ACON4X_08890 [Polaribacter sp.]
MKGLKITDFGHGNVKKDLSIYIPTTDRAFFNKFERGTLNAQVCGSCGNMELSVSNFRELWEAYNLKTS